MIRALVAEVLASALLATDWSRSALIASVGKALGRRVKAAPLVERVLAEHPEAPRAAFDELVAFLASDPFTLRATKTRARSVLRIVTPVLAMRDVRPSWGLPELATTGAVAEWLGLSIADLAWLSDMRGFARRPGRDARLDHYVRRWIPKRSGAPRLLEAPKRSLKEAQRRILHDLLARIPPHPAAHGFVRGRSVLGNAQLHAGKAVVLRLDLEDFFLSVRGAWIEAIFLTAGYPQEVARVLTGLVTTATPMEGTWMDRARACMRHLPQGAPTSPALANLAAYGLDVRLGALAAHHDATYTRYADDLVFSGVLPRQLASLVERIVFEEGFVVNRAKTRRMGTGQRQSVTGLVVNDLPAVSRRERDRLEAILVNAVRTGGAEQNRNAHPDFQAYLAGRIGWVQQVNPAHASKLRALFDKIAW